MKKSDLKQLIKPLVKECIHEVLLEEGLLSNVVSEVAKGLQGNLVVEARPPQANVQPREDAQMHRQAQKSREDLKEHRRKLMDAIGNDAYGGVNLFEGTEPLHSNEPKQGQADLGNPKDAGVDISSIFGNASQIWQAMK
tara:strand:- start:91 stop:507 length:417 start_codon:yes stop_codon:yes gene_type:complete